MTALVRLAAVGLLMLLGLARAGAEVSEIKITKQPSLMYLQMVIMEDRKLMEKHAAAAGISPLKVDWVTFSSGGVATDSLLAGAVDIVTSGVSNMLLLWGKTNGQVKAIVGVAGLPMQLLTRNPNIKSIRDFGPMDRIAVPTIKVSMQSTVLGIALEKEYGSIEASQKLVVNQVQLGHPEATIALLNPQHEINAHFSLSPYMEIALKNPAIRSVLNSNDALGGPAQITCAFTTQKFREANPKLMKAFIAAFDEASELIAKDPMAAAQIYLAMTKERISAEELVALLKTPGGIFNGTPVNTKIYADYMQRSGIIKPKAESWKDYFFPDIHDRNGS